MILLKRAYDKLTDADGPRFLVERLWPRGVKKSALRIDAWLRDAAPSTALRKWFSHDPAKWNEFRKRYLAELSANPEAWQALVDAARSGTITLIYSSHDGEHSNAVALKEFVETKLSSAKARPEDHRKTPRATRVVKKSVF
jgi:uncharacterized protein YeaO (DUF488 family)